MLWEGSSLECSEPGMADLRDPASMLTAAERAAAAGDYREAERLFRNAASIQEASLGSVHPDLAITLNNLALVCERLNKFDEAERGYRRAHRIALASLRPGHPFIATSLENLVHFCASHGISIWKPLDRRSDDQIVSPAPEAEAPPELMQPVHGTGSPWPRRTTALAAVGVVVIVAVVSALQGWGRTSSPDPRLQGQGVSSARETPEWAAATPALIPETQPAPTSDRPGGSPSAVGRRDPPATSAASVSVLHAGLCSALEKRGSPDWRCASVSGDSQPGTFILYTRLRTNADTTVEHRWYRGDRLHQVMRLHVAANPVSGYRTFSTNTISPERAGDWKVELRTADGTLLFEEHFAIH